MSTADLAVDSGQALLDLGDTRQARQLIREGQDLLPPSRDKTRGVFLTYQARSHLELREPERAAAAALQALQVARCIGAPWCVSLVRELVPSFKTFPNAQGVGYCWIRLPRNLLEAWRKCHSDCRGLTPDLGHPRYLDLESRRTVVPWS
ncbi:hypothetical protein [Streptomyces sp. 142MFCol3.1]|uniref:hypothetical protein n=1 Tax=Streptomyces sp. 142MFCol3.1 TaxID=1172179 RepID=UPI00048C543F|nr:hypothetical protein [Streptomyces sp. 142MFCol3.1]